MFRNVAAVVIVALGLTAMAQVPQNAQPPPEYTPPQAPEYAPPQAVNTPAPQYAPRQAAPTPTTEPQTLSGAISAIKSAQDPTEAVRVYLDAQKTFGNDTDLMTAYVHKMVESGMPQPAGPAASQLVRINPNDGLAWAVVAYMDLSRNNLSGRFRPCRRLYSFRGIIRL